ncbi:centrosomal protein of 170 kDa protein B [Diretmus argenteus]
MSVTSWFLVSSSGTRHRLPQEMIFVGRDDCELMLQSRSVDKQHAVVNYDPNTDEHMVKDLGSLNGTFVNDLRIPDQTYITLKLSDVIRFGYDILFNNSHVYILEKNQHKVPEEALKHEKYTNQLQLSLKALEARKKEKQQLQSLSRESDSSNAKLLDRAERKAHSATATTDSPISKPTPLYGQPSWWGEDEDPNNKEQRKGQETTKSSKEISRYEVNGSLSDSQAQSIFSHRREPSYFEIPTKEFQQQPAKKSETEVHEVPTKDTPDPSLCVPSTPTPPVAQSHASFTIEFDDCMPGKMKIKDHVTKFSSRQHRKLPSIEVVTTPTEVMSAESKVADWLVQSNTSMMRRRSQTEDIYTKSDQSIQMVTKAHHEDHSDSGDLAVNEKSLLQSGPPVGLQVSQPPQRASPPHHFTSPDSKESYSPPESQSPPSLGKTDPHQAFVIEFFDDNPRKKRSQSFTNNPIQPDTSGHRTQLDKAKKGSSPSGQRQDSSLASSTPPTQRYTVPLKGSGSSGHQRAGSLRRQNTEERISTGFSSRSSTVTVRPFGSVGRKSRLAQDFAAEFLKQAKQASSASREKNTTSSTTTSPPVTVVTPESHQSPVSPPPPTAPYLAQTSSPIHQAVPLKVPTMSLVPQSMEVKSPHVGPRNEEEDSLSDAGTYTIEGDAQDKEVEEARNKINEVFGVVESPEQTNQTEAETSATYRPVIIQGREQHRQSSFYIPMQVQPGGPELQGPPKWMSRWASLADSYTDSGPSSGLFDNPSQMELPKGAGGRIIHKVALSRNHNGTDPEASRARRILPQVPPGEKNETPTPNIHVHYDLQSTFDLEESRLVAPGSQDALHRLTVRDDVEPDSLSDTSKSDDGSIIEQRKRPLCDTLDKKNKEDKPRLSAKSTSFYIGAEEAVSKPECGGSAPNSPKMERKQPPKTFSTATLTKQRGNQDFGKVKHCVSAPVLDQETESPEFKEGPVNALVRQDSFTKDQPSNTRLPNISSQADSDTFQGASNQDTHSYLKETEDVLAVLEAKLQASQPESIPSPVTDSLSGESDVDTSSTVSQRSNKTRPTTATKKPSNSFHRERSSTRLDSNHQSSAVERVSEKHRTQGAGSNSKTDTGRRPVGLRRSVGKHGSADLSDDPQSSSRPYSDQESSSHQTHKKYTTPLQKEDTKPSKVSQTLSRSNSLSAPRSTRASMLRRARLGEASDNEGTETDRLSQEAGSVPAKQLQEAKKLSRLDMLAMPRKRTSSLNPPSDTEASTAPTWAGRTTGFSNRSTESSSSSARKAAVPGPRPAPQKAALSKTPVTRGRSNSTKYSSSTASSRRRQKGSDYTSTSEEEEYDSNQSTPKHKRSQPSSASHSPRDQSRPRPQPLVALRPKPRSGDSEEESHEGEAFHNWSNHSAEIARLSQDLAKDLAILAREIHDVAGDAEPQSSGEEINKPVSTVTAHEELVQRIPEAGQNYHRVPPPGSAAPREHDQNPNDHEPNSRQRAMNREEVVVDNLMLNPVSQISMVIRQNTEQLAEKIKVLFQDKMDVWEEIEAKMNSENDVPVLKTSNKEITSILKELRRVQRQLEVINSVIEPSGQPDVTKVSAPVTTSSTGVRPSRPPVRDFRTVHSASHRGGGPRPSESVRRAAVTPDDVREGYLV